MTQEELLADALGRIQLALTQGEKTMKHHMIHPQDRWITADRLISEAKETVSNRGLTALASGLPIPPKTVEDAMEILCRIEGAEFEAVGVRDGKDRADFVEGLEGEGKLYIP